MESVDKYSALFFSLKIRYIQKTSPNAMRGRGLLCIIMGILSNFRCSTFG